MRRRLGCQRLQSREVELSGSPCVQACQGSLENKTCDRDGNHVEKEHVLVCLHGPKAHQGELGR